MSRDTEQEGLGWEAAFAQQLKRMREQRHWSQTELAKQLTARGLPFHQQQVQRIEAGERPVRLNEAMLLANLFGISLERLTQADAPTAAERVRSARTRLQVLATQLFTDLEAVRQDLSDASRAFFESYDAYRSEHVRARVATNLAVQETLDKDREALREFWQAEPTIDRSLRQLLSLGPMDIGISLTRETSGED